jgi:hypothetical protein
MAEEIAKDTAPSRETKRSFAIAALLFSFATISYVVVAGDPTNSLHQSALSWGFTMAMFVMGVYAFSVSYDNFVVRKWKV